MGYENGYYEDRYYDGTNNNNTYHRNEEQLGSPTRPSVISPDIECTYDYGDYNYEGNEQTDDHSTEMIDSVGSTSLSSLQPKDDNVLNSSFRQTLSRRFSYKQPRSKLFARDLSIAVLIPEDEEGSVEMDVALKRRLRDFRFAQRKRKEKYGSKRPRGIVGLYFHFNKIREDIEWAEDAAWRRENDKPYLRWDDFDETKDTGYNKPFFTYLVIIVCTICLIISLGLNGWKIQPITENPMIGPSEDVLGRMGAKDTSRIIYDNEWYRLFTAMFLHAGIIHYAINVSALWFIGTAVELNHGSLATTILFILPALGGNLYSALFLSKYLVVGSSGGIFGLIGACLADIVCNWGFIFSPHVNENDADKPNHISSHIKVLLWIALDITIGLIIGLTPFLDNFTLLCGIIFGYCCGLSTMKRLSTDFFGEEEHWIQKVKSVLVRFLGILFTCSCILTALSTLISMKNGDLIQCVGCNYISCVPFPFWTEEKWWYCD